MSKDKLGNEYFLLLVHLNWNSLPIIVHTHIAIFGVDLNLEQIHLPISLIVIRSIDEHFIKDFV